MTKKNLLIALFLFSEFLAFAQPNQLKIFGRVVYGKDGLSAAHVILKLDGQEVEKIITDKSGKFEFLLNFDNIYYLEMTKNGFVTKTLEINTYDAPDAQKEFGYQFGGWQVSLFKEYPGLNTEVLEAPVGRIFYDELINNFDYDIKYQRQIVDKLDQLNAQVAQLEKQETQQLKLNQKAYDEAIKAADKAFYADDFAEAKTQYQNALSFKPDEDYPTKQLQATNQKIALLENENTQYQQIIKEANDLLANGNLESAKAKFGQAKLIKPKETLPDQKISEIDKLINDKLVAEKQAQAIAEQRNANYSNAYSSGVSQLESGNFEQAIAQAKKALEVKPNDANANKLLAEAENSLKAKQLAEQQAVAQKNEDLKNQKVVDLLTQAEEKLENQNFAEAKTIIAEAKKLGANTKVLEDKITREELAFNQKKQTDEEKKQAIAKAEGLAQTNLNQAISQLEVLKAKYPTDALIAVKLDDFKQQKAKEQAMADAKSLAEKQKIEAENKAEAERQKLVQLETLIAEAEKLNNAKNFKAALEKFAEAELIAKNDVRIIEGKQRANKAIQEQNEADRNLNNLVSLAENQFKANNFKASYDRFQEASSINPKDPRVIEGLRKTKQKLDEQQAANKTAVANAQKTNMEKINIEEDPSEYTTEFLNQLAKEYPPGVTEVVYKKGNSVVTKRVVVVGGTGTVYRRVKHSWGGEYYFRNNDPITNFIWDKETNL